MARNVRVREFLALHIDATVVLMPPSRLALGLHRPSTGPCDRAEYCTGFSAACPADAFLPSTTVCRESAGDCDPKEYCTGTSGPCPNDQLQPSTFVCRPAAGACDQPEYCTGSSAT